MAEKALEATDSIEKETTQKLKNAEDALKKTKDQVKQAVEQITEKFSPKEEMQYHKGIISDEHLLGIAKKEYLTENLDISANQVQTQKLEKQQLLELRVSFTKRSNQ